MMRLNNAPPKGAGRGQAASKTEALLRIIEGLGTDKGTMNPIGIRTRALAERADINPNSISVLLAPHVASGRLWVCKVTVPGTPPQNEYRKGSGVAVPAMKPLSSKRAGVAVGAPGKPLPVTTPAVALSTPAADKPAAPVIPVFRTQQAQPAVAENTGSGPAVPPFAAAPAVAAQATPKPAAGAALKREPAARQASAGDVRIGINAEGTLVIALGEDSIELDIHQALRLGDFMHATQGVWRPYGRIRHHNV